MLADLRVAGGAGPAQQHRPGARDLFEEPVGVEATVQQHQHPRPEKVQQPGGQRGLVPVGDRADGGAQQGAGAGLGQGHQPQRGIPGPAHPVADPADPAPVALGVGDLHRVAAIEGDGAQPAEPHPGRMRLGQRPGHHLEQRLQRHRAQAAAQIPQRLLRRARQAQPGQPRGQLPPHPRITKMWEQSQRQHEIHPGPGRQQPQPPLHRLGLLQDVIDQFERQVLG